MRQVYWCPLHHRKEGWLSDQENAAKHPLKARTGWFSDRLEENHPGCVGFGGFAINFDDAATPPCGDARRGNGRRQIRSDILLERTYSRLHWWLLFSSSLPIIRPYGTSSGTTIKFFLKNIFKFWNFIRQYFEHWILNIEDWILKIEYLSGPDGYAYP